MLFATVWFGKAHCPRKAVGNKSLKEVHVIQNTHNNNTMNNVWKKTMYPKSKVPYNTLCSFLWILTNCAQACENVTVCTFERLLRGVTEPGLSWTETFLGRFRKCFSDGSVPTRALWKSSAIFKKYSCWQNECCYGWRWGNAILLNWAFFVSQSCSMMW